MSNVIPLNRDTASVQAAHLVRDAKAISGLDNRSFAKWLRRIADDLDAIAETRQ